MGYHSCKENHRQIVAGHSPYSRRGHIENENEAWLGKPDRKSFFTIRRVMMDREWTTNILLLPPITVALIDYFLQLTVSIMFIYLAIMKCTKHTMECVCQKAQHEQPLNSL